MTAPGSPDHPAALGHVALVVNPAARGGSVGDLPERVAERLRSAGIRTTVVSGGSAAESTALLRTALEAGADAVLVAGGDGTVSLAIQELAGTGIPLGIVPTGTGNDLAAAVGLRELDAAGAADAVIAGRTRTIDVARVTARDGSQRLFGTVLASGFDSRVNDRANRMRWPRGHARYNLALLIEFVTLRGLLYTVEITGPGGDVEHLDGAYVMATVGNSRSYGGGIPICPDADPADGLLDVLLVRPAGRLRLLRLLPRVYRGTHTAVDEVITRRACSVRLASPRVTAYADGDPVGALPLRIDVVPRALTVFSVS